MRLKIEEDKNIGFYLVVYPHDSNQSLADYLQDTLENAIEEAKEKYNVSPEKWIEFKQ
jgi:S-ribosylhomocysteine lyase LuxS involved in autoinducer biosynthesis